MYSRSARRVSFEIQSITRELRRAEDEYMSKHPPFNVLVTPVVLRRVGRFYEK